MYVVAGVSGHTGRGVAETLLAQKEKVRVIVRDSKQGETWKHQGAEVYVAQLGDAVAVAKALSGAHGAYLLLPPRYDAEDMLAAQRPVIEALAEAVRKSGVPHVVLLSSLGAELSEGTGPIQSLHHAERTLGAASKNITFLRAGYFIENFASALPATQGGALPTFLTPNRAIPMAAAADIGRAAAELLLEPATGTRVVEFTTTRDWSPNDVAGELTRILGRTITTQFSSIEAVVPTLIGMGLPRGVAELVREMTDAINKGLVRRQGPPALRRFGQLGAGDVLKGLLEKTPSHA